MIQPSISAREKRHIPPTLKAGIFLAAAKRYTRYSEIHTGRATWGQFGLTVAVGAILLVVGIWLLTKATGVL